MPQHKYQEIKNKPSRYKLVGKIDSKSIKCNEIKNGNVNVFTCRIDKYLDKRGSYTHYAMAVDRLHEWQDFMGFKGSLKDTAINKMAHDLSRQVSTEPLNIKVRIILNISIIR